jgi:hypothetical protein
MHLLTSTKKSFSARELQRQLGHKRYHPVWHMAHKLREAMGKRDGEYIPAGRIELDGDIFRQKYHRARKTAVKNGVVVAGRKQKCR